MEKKNLENCRKINFWAFLQNKSTKTQKKTKTDQKKHLFAFWLTAPYFR